MNQRLQSELIALESKKSPSDDLAVDMAYGAILRKPGCTFNAVQKNAGVSRRKFAEALNTLVQNGRVTTFQDGSCLLYFLTEPGLHGCWRQVVALHKHGLAPLHRWHLKQGPCERSRILRYAIQELGWPARTSRERLGMLVRFGLAMPQQSLSNDQRCRWLRALEPDDPARNVLQASEAHLSTGLPTSSDERPKGTR